MSTTNTNYEWYWYLLKKGRYWTLGLVDENGDSPDSALEMEIICEKLPDDLTSDDDILPIRTEHELGFAQGVAAEIMKMSKRADKNILALYTLEYNKMRSNVHHELIKESQGPALLKPVDFRND